MVRQDQVNRVRNTDHAAWTCERFVYSIVEITRLYIFEKFMRCTKVCGPFFLIVVFGCWLAGQANSVHMDYIFSLRHYFNPYKFITQAGRHRVLKWAPFVFRIINIFGVDYSVLRWLVRGLMTSSLLSHGMTRSNVLNVWIFLTHCLMADSIVGLVCFQ